MRTPRLVAQIVNLLYRRFSTCRDSDSTGGQPASNRRRRRLRIRATATLAPHVALITVSASVLLGVHLSAQPASTNDLVRFRTVDVYVDSKEHPLAAYQLEFSVADRTAKIVGIEGGEHPAFVEPPYFDPKAMQHERVVIAAFSTNAVNQLPKGKKRVATIHLQTGGAAEPEFILTLQASSDSNGNRIPAEAAVAERQAK